MKKQNYNQEISNILKTNHVLDYQMIKINDQNFTVTMQCEKKVGLMPKITNQKLYDLILGIKTDVASLKTDVASLKTDVASLKKDMDLIKSLPTIKKELAELNQKNF